MDIIESLTGLWHSTGLANFITTPQANVVGLEKYLQMFGMPIMIVVCFFLLYLGIKKLCDFLFSKRHIVKNLFKR